FADEDAEILSYQRVSGNGHELDEMEADLAKLQARLSATDDDDELDKLVAQRKALRARISGFELVPDSLDYGLTGQRVAGVRARSDEGKRRLVKAVANSIGLDITAEWGMDEHSLWLHTMPSELVCDGIVDLGEGVCFRVSQSV